MIELFSCLIESANKIRIFSPNQKKNCGTYLGPAFGSNVSKLLVFRGTKAGRNYLAYATDTNVAGLMSWPPQFDSTSMGVIVQPSAILSIAVSFDGRKLLTLGESGTVNMWDIDTSAIDALSDLQEEGSRDISQVAEPGTLEEIRNYFYYAQIRHQGEDTTEERHITGLVPLDAVPNLMRALGYYPSQAEIQDMVDELEHQAAIKVKPPPTSIDFNSFVSLYLRYRPEVPISQNELEAAFRVLGGETGKVNREKLVALLLSRGEPLSEEELADTLQLLVGTDSTEDAFSPTVDARAFAAVLGLEEVEA